MKQLTLTYEPQRTPNKVSLPLSKSVALRVMPLNAVAVALNKRPAKIAELPDCEDVEGMRRALEVYYRQLSYLRGRISDAEDDGLEFERVNIGEGGAPLRFFMALAASTPGIRIILDCEESLKRRPHSVLVQELRKAGAEIAGEGNDGVFPPYRISGQILSSDNIMLGGTTSSQYIFALMIVSALWLKPLHLSLTTDSPVSTPYIRMTADLLRQYGMGVDFTGSQIKVGSGIDNVNTGEPYGLSQFTPPASVAVPEDWSAASYYYELAAISNIPVELTSLTPPDDSLQGDAAAAGLFSNFDISTDYFSAGGARLQPLPGHPLPDNLRLHLSDTPDLTPALAVTACMSGIPFRFTGIGHLRHKETDRLQGLQDELRKLGFIITTDGDCMMWKGERCVPDPFPEIETYHDHRMAMAFAPAAFRFPGLKILNPGVVGKSFPGYWHALQEFGFRLTETES